MYVGTSVHLPPKPLFLGFFFRVWLSPPPPSARRCDPRVLKIPLQSPLHRNSVRNQRPKGSLTPFYTIPRECAFSQQCPGSVSNGSGRHFVFSCFVPFAIHPCLLVRISFCRHGRGCESSRLISPRGTYRISSPIYMSAWASFSMVTCPVELGQQQLGQQAH